MAVPVPIAVIDPVAAPIVAMDALLVVHVPPVVAFVQFVVLPIHTVLYPVAVPGTVFTVSIVARRQPAALV